MTESVDPAFLTATELLAAYRQRRLSPVQVVARHLARLRALEPILNAFQLVDDDGALAAAAAAERRWAKGAPAGDLDGVPVTIKDIVAVRGWPTRSGSATSGDTPEVDDAPCVARLRAAGAIFLGKTTTPEFGWKGMTDGPLFGITRNPWNPRHTPGGSTGGGGAALAAGIGALAHGTDGGGSIRIPSGYCGLYGLKPTFGRVPHSPQDGVFTTLVSSGPLARSVEDCALMLNVIARPDHRDGAAFPHDGRDWRAGLADGVKGLRVGVTAELGGARVDAPVRAAFDAAVGVFTAAGARVEAVGRVFEPLRPRFEAYWKAGFAKLLRGVPPERREQLDTGFRRLAEEGLAVGLEAVYAGLAARADLAARMGAFHRDFDVLLTPTLPTLPPPADTVYHSPGFDRWDHAVPFTLPFNLTGQPAASVPCGMSPSGLPIGLQIVAARGREDLVLRAMRAFEAAAPFPRPHPQLAASLAKMGV